MHCGPIRALNRGSTESKTRKFYEDPDQENTPLHPPPSGHAGDHHLMVSVQLPTDIKHTGIPHLDLSSVQTSIHHSQDSGSVLGSHEAQLPWTSCCPKLSVWGYFGPSSLQPRSLHPQQKNLRAWRRNYSLFGPDGALNNSTPGYCLLDQFPGSKNFSLREMEVSPCVWPSFLYVLLGLGPRCWTHVCWERH